MAAPILGTVKKFTTSFARPLVGAMLLICMIGCARTSKTENAQGDQSIPDDPRTTTETSKTKKYHFATPEAVTKAMADIVLHCDGPCPESSGVLLMQEGSDVSTCSFSLVGPDIILTNRHCVPNSMASNGADCDGKIQAIFAKASSLPTIGSSLTTAEKEVYACAKILSVPKNYDESPEKVLQPDYAFIKLDRVVNRQPLKFAQGGLQDGEILTALTATPHRSGDIVSSILAAKSCQVHMNSVQVSDFTNPFAPVGAFKNCPIIYGNSGSALIDKNGAIKAVIHSFTDPKIKSPFPPNSLPAKASALGVSGKFAFGTNAVCLENAELGLSPTANGCDSNPSVYEPGPEVTPDKAKEAAFFQEKLTALESTVPELAFQDALDNDDAETMTSRSEARTITLIPRCIRGSASGIPWLPKYAEGDKKSPHYPAMRARTYLQPSVRYSLDLDQNSRFLVARELLFRKVTLNLPVAKIAGGFTGSLKISGSRIESAHATTVTPVEYDLELCGD